MQYYKMMTDGSKKRNNDILARSAIEAEDRFILYKGIIVTDWNNDMTFECDPKEGYITTDFLCNNYGWTIFSEKAINLLGDLVRNDIQLLPVKVVNKNTNAEIGRYFVINILPFLDALDLENSVYNYIGEENSLSVIKYGIKEEKADGHHIFRLKDSKFAIFISEEFYKIVKKNKMVGCDFLKVHTS